METTRSTFRGANEGLAHEVLGMRHVYKATTRETGGCYVSFELEVPPGRSAPLHVHAVDSESFYVLEGELRFTDATGTRVARRGEFVLLPAGTAHAFENATAEPARALVVAAPGVEAERFFAEIDERGTLALDPVAVTAIAARHGLTILPPAAG